MSTWEEIRDKKRKLQAEAIPIEWRLKSIPEDFRSSIPIIESCGILTAEELAITNETNAQLLLDKIHSGTLTSLEVTIAYCKRAAVLQQLTKCCTELMFDRAIKTAKKLDEDFQRSGKPTGPLHGLPISIKDTFEIEGYDSSLGWAAECFKPAQEDGLIPLLTITRLGAVPYVKSNIPQSLMMSDSYNHIFGQSVNSLNRHLISGGSSGGEGALVGAFASPIGIGTDIGGSIRIPAALQGMYGLCPSRGRIPNRESARYQKHLVPPVAGPITSSITTLETYMSAYLSSEPWTIDPTLHPIPWRPNLSQLPPPTRKLRIAFISDDGVVLPQPPITRAISDLRKLFEQFGHETLDWDTSTHRSAYYDLWLPSVLADGGKRCAELCARGGGQPLIEGMLVGTPPNLLSVPQRQSHAEKIFDYQYTYLHHLTTSKIDAIILPVTPFVGLRPKQWVLSHQYVGYSSIANLLDYPALAIPSGTVVNKQKDSPLILKGWNEHNPRNESDEYNHKQYDIDLLEGMPVAVQIMTGRLEEEKCVMIGKVIEDMRQRAKMTNGVH